MGRVRKRSPCPSRAQSVPKISAVLKHAIENDPSTFLGTSLIHTDPDSRCARVGNAARPQHFRARFPKRSCPEWEGIELITSLAPSRVVPIQKSHETLIVAGHEQMGYEALLPALDRLIEAEPDAGARLAELLGGPKAPRDSAYPLAIGTIVRAFDQMSCEKTRRPKHSPQLRRGRNHWRVGELLPPTRTPRCRNAPCSACSTESSLPSVLRGRGTPA